MILAPSQLFGDPALDARARPNDIRKGMITLQVGAVGLVKAKQWAACKYYVISSNADNNHPGSVCWEIK